MVDYQHWEAYDKLREMVRALGFLAICDGSIEEIAEMGDWEMMHRLKKRDPQPELARFVPSQSGMTLLQILFQMVNPSFYSEAEVVYYDDLMLTGQRWWAKDGELRVTPLAAVYGKPIWELMELQRAGDIECGMRRWIPRIMCLMPSVSAPARQELRRLCRMMPMRGAPECAFAINARHDDAEDVIEQVYNGVREATEQEILSADPTYREICSLLEGAGLQVAWTTAAQLGHPKPDLALHLTGTF